MNKILKTILLILIALAGFSMQAFAAYFPFNTNVNMNIGIGTSIPQGAFVVMNGNVGIGTWVPSTPLQVNGDISFATGTAGNIYTTLPASGTGPDLTIRAAQVCFAANTKITMSDGSLKNIQSIKIGDSVKTYDEKSRQVRNSRVIKLISHSSKEDGVGYLIMTMHNGQILKVTPNHPIYVDGQWKQAGSLKVGDQLMQIDGSKIKLMSIQMINEEIPVYNLELKQYHTYFAQGILVHNSCVGAGGNLFLGGSTQNAQAGGTILAYSTQSPTTLAKGGYVGIGTTANSTSQNSLLTIFGNVAIGKTSGDSYLTTAAPSGGMIVEGNVGIGSLAPGQALDVTGTVRMTGLTLTGNGAASGNVLVTNGIGVGTWMPASTLPGTGVSNYWLNDITGNVGISTTYAVGIGTSFVGGTGEAALSVMNGNVGIGTWVPVNSLDVNGGGAFGSYAGQKILGSGNVGISGNLGIGTWLPSSRLQIMGGPQASGASQFFNYDWENGTAGSFLGTSLQQLLQAAANSSAQFTALNVYSSVNNNVNYTGNILALQEQFFDQGTGTISNVIGGEYNIVNTTTGTITNATAGIFGVNNQSTGAVTNAYGVGVSTVQGGTYGYGVWVTGVSGAANNYDFYGADSSAKNYFAGNVGIGSLAPGQALDVTGTVRAIGFTMSGQTPISGYVLTAQDSAGDTTWSSAGAVGGWTVSGSNVYETSGGNVGIGTTKVTTAALTVMNGNVGIGTWVPGFPLYVVGVIESSSLVASYALQSNGFNASAYTSTGSSVYPGQDNFYARNTATTDGSSSNYDFMVTNSNGNPQNAYISAISNTGGSTYTPTIVIGQQTTSNAYAERVRIDQNGNVGIGSTAPGQALDVTGTVRAIGFTMSGQTPVSGYVLTAQDSAGDTTWTSAGAAGGWTVSGANVYETSGGNVGIGTFNPFGGKLIVTGGNVGIGSLTPGQALDVQGTIRVEGYVTASVPGATVSFAAESVGSPAGGFFVGNSVSDALASFAVTDPYSSNAVQIPVSFVLPTDQNVTDTNEEDLTISIGVPGLVPGVPAATIFLSEQRGRNSGTNGLPMVFSTQNSVAPALYIDNASAQNVGIGTWVPSGLLEVGNRKFDVLSGGNVGIGSINPGQALDINGTARMAGFILSGNGAASGNVMVTNGVGVGTWMSTTTLPIATVAVETTGDVTYYSASNSFAGGTGFQTNGTNVGIGTSNLANASFQVVGNIGIGTVKNGDNFINTAPSNGGLIVEGNVGIGTWAPTKPLSVTGDTYLNGNIGIGTTFVGGAGEGAVSVMNGNVGIGTWVPAGQLDVEGTLSVVYFKGNVGIGTATVPQYTLDLVNGTSRQRYVRRVQTTASSASLTMNTDITDLYTITALAAAITLNNPTGTPNNGDLLEIRILDNGTARGITWGTNFASTSTILPTTTVAGITIRVLLEYDSAQTKWECIGVT